MLKCSYISEMSKFQKTVDKLLNLSSSLTFQELEYVLRKLNYIEKKTGKTSGSRKAYIHKQTKHIIRLHKPDPGNEIKKYVRSYIIIELKKEKHL